MGDRGLKSAHGVSSTITAKVFFGRCDGVKRVRPDILHRIEMSRKF